MVYVLEQTKKFMDTAPECSHGYKPGIKLHLNSSKYVGY